MSETDAQATEARAAAKRAPGRPWPDGEIRQVLLAPADREVLSRLAKRLKRSIDAIDVVRRIGATAYPEQSPKQRDGKFWRQVTMVAVELGELPPARCAPLASGTTTVAPLEEAVEAAVAADALEPAPLEAQVPLVAPLAEAPLAEAPLEAAPLEAAPLEPAPVAPLEAAPLEAFAAPSDDFAGVPVAVTEPLEAAPTLVDIFMHPIPVTPTEMLFGEEAAPLSPDALAIGSGPVLAEPVFPVLALTDIVALPPVPFSSGDSERPAAGPEEVTWPGLAAVMAMAAPAAELLPALLPDVELLPAILPAAEFLPAILSAAEPSVLPVSAMAPALVLNAPVIIARPRSAEPAWVLPLAAPPDFELDDDTPLPAPIPLIAMDVGGSHGFAGRGGVAPLDDDEPELPPFDPSSLVPVAPFKDVTMAELTFEIDGIASLDAGTMELRGPGESLEGTLLIPSVAGMTLIGLPEGGDEPVMDLDQLDEVGLETSPELPPSVLARLEAPVPIATITVTAPMRVARAPKLAAAEPPPDIASFATAPRADLPEIEVDLGLMRKGASWVVARARRDRTGAISVRRAGPIRLNNDQMNEVARRFRQPACVPGLSAVPVELEPGHPDHFLAAAAHLPHDVVVIGEPRRPR